MAYLRMNESVVEEDEPVDGEAASILQGQSFVAALTDQAARWLAQRVLRQTQTRVKKQGQP